MSESTPLGFDVLTKDETAKVLRVSVRKLELMIAAGEGPPITSFGRRHLFCTDALAGWVASRTLPPGQRPEVRAS